MTNLTQIYANNATTVLFSSVAPTDTTITVTNASAFPIPSSQEYFLATMEANGAIEIVKVTGVSGNTFTGVIRGQEGTVAQTFAAGARIDNRITAGTLTSFETVYNAITELPSVDNLLPPLSAGSNEYLCHSNDVDGSPIIALRISSYKWEFNTHKYPVVSSSVLTASSTSITSAGIGSLIPSVITGQYIIQFTSGVNIGTARAIISSGTNTVSWATAYTTTPSTGDTFIIVESNLQAFYNLQASAPYDTTAVSLAGGTAGALPYQTGAGSTNFISAGTNGNVLTMVAGNPAWSSTPTLTGTNFTGIPNGALTNSSITIGSTSVSLGSTATTLAGLTSVTSTTFVGALTGNASTATTANNIAGGTTGALHYQTSANNTGFIATGTNGYVLTMVSGSPAWAASSGGFVNPMTTAGDIIYENATPAAARLGIGTTGQVLTVVSGLPAWSSSPTLTGTNFTSIPNGALTNSSVTIGSTSVSLGATVTTFVGLSSVTSTTFVGALTGNASTATAASNISGGTTGALHYQTSANNTGFIATGTNGYVLTMVSGSPAWAASSAGFSNPMTTAGDIIFENATPAPARLGIGTTGQVLTVVSGLPAWSSTPTLTGTNFTGIPNGALSNSSVTIGSTNIALGATSTTLAGITGFTTTADITVNTINVGLGGSAVSTNTSVGNGALTNNTTGGGIVAIGQNAGNKSTTSTYSTYIGYIAGQGITTGNQNTVLGAYALNVGGAISGMVALGYQASRHLGIGVATVSITAGSGYTNGTYYNVQLTYTSGTAVSSTGSYPTATIVVSGGTVTGVTITNPGGGFTDLTTVMTTAAANIGGTGSGFSCQTASLTSAPVGVTAVGTLAGSSNVSGTACTYIGANAGANQVTGGYNFYLGYDSGQYGYYGSYNTGIGANTLQNNTNGTYNVAIGAYAGYQTGSGVVTGTSSMNIVNAGSSYTNGTYTGVVLTVSSGTPLSAHASSVGPTATITVSGGVVTSINVTSPGDGVIDAGTIFTAAAASIGGTGSGFTCQINGSANIITGVANIAIGYNALKSNMTGSDNVAIGFTALTVNTATGNVGIGYNALASNTTGANNVAIGLSAGNTGTAGAYANITGNNNTWIGYQAGPNSSTQYSNATAIGYQATTTASNQVVLGNSSVTSTVAFGTLSVPSVTFNTYTTKTSFQFVTSTTAAGQVADSYSTTLYRTSEYLISITSGSSYQAIKILLLQDGTNTFINPFGTISSSSSLATFSATISGGNVQLLVTPVNASTTFNIVRVGVSV